jgi:hypothetical protein
MGRRTEPGTEHSSPIPVLDFNQRDREAGSSLILAMVFLVAVSLVISALASWTMNNLNNTVKFRYTTSRLYAAQGATQIAVRASRYSYSPNTNPTGYVCPGTDTPLAINGVFVQDWCQTSLGVGSTVTRQLTVTACQVPLATSKLNGPCLLVDGTVVDTLLTAVVNFDDNTPSMDKAAPNCTSTANQSTCGASMIVTSWIAK